MRDWVIAETDSIGGILSYVYHSVIASSAALRIISASSDVIWLSRFMSAAGCQPPPDASWSATRGVAVELRPIADLHRTVKSDSDLHHHVGIHRGRFHAVGMIPRHTSQYRHHPVRTHWLRPWASERQGNLPKYTQSLKPPIGCRWRHHRITTASADSVHVVSPQLP